MRIVALTSLRGTLDEAASGLATVLGLSSYDVRSRFAGALPKILCYTRDDAVALKLSRDLAQLGHGVTVADRGAVVPSTSMVRLHRFQLDTAGLWANDQTGDRLAWGDLGVVIVMLLRSQVTWTAEEPPTFRGAPRPEEHYAVDVTKTEHGSFLAAYLLPHSRAVTRTPWLLDETKAQYLSLGPAMQPTRRANFQATLAAMRRLAPHAIVDDRFVSSPLATLGARHVRGYLAAAPERTTAFVDGVVHVLAGMLLGRGQAGPYRG